MSIKAVLTGDLMHSQVVSDTHAFLGGLEQVLNALKKRYGLRTEIFRGRC